MLEQGQTFSAWVAPEGEATAVAGAYFSAASAAEVLIISKLPDVVSRYGEAIDVFVCDAGGALHFFEVEVEVDVRATARPAPAVEPDIPCDHVVVRLCREPGGAAPRRPPLPLLTTDERGQSSAPVVLEVTFMEQDHGQMRPRDTTTCPVYVSSLLGYAPDSHYEHRRALISSAGFVRLDGVNAKGEREELYRLACAQVATGPCQGMKDGDEVAAWVMSAVRPGVVEVAGKRWGLALD